VNLKQAARHLGVHYQTAYKLVRSGRLAAVCIGARYEISEAAIEAYLAERQALRRAPARPRRAPAGARPASDPFAAAEAALRALTGSTATVMELVAEALVTSLGDLAVTRELSLDGTTFLPAVVRHADPVRRATAAATVGEWSMAVAGSRVLSIVADGELVLREIVAQDCVRRGVDAEVTQYLDDTGVHSMIVAPARADDAVVGLVAVTRDQPGRPYTRDDVAIVERAAAITGAAIMHGRLTTASRRRRRALVEAVGELFEADNESSTADSLLAAGPVGELVCDVTGRVFMANHAVGRLLGTPVDEMLGRRLAELVATDAQGPHAAQLDRLVRGELSFADSRLRRVNGTHEPAPADVALRLAIVRDVQAQPRAIVGVAHELPVAAVGE